MNKRTRAIDEETYKLIIATMKNGFIHESVQYKPNERIATVLVLEYNHLFFCGADDTDIIKRNRKKSSFSCIL